MYTLRFTACSLVLSAEVGYVSFMAANTMSDTTAFSEQIRKLLEDRERHAKAMQSIDATLQQVRKLLASDSNFGRPGRGSRGRVGRPPGKTATTRRKKRSRGRFETSGDVSVLQFVQEKGSPSTREINAHWKSEGRRGSADNALSKLVKEKKLKRRSTPDERGSRYTVA
jgi:hypothetical protein